MRESKALFFLKFTGILLLYQKGFIEAFVVGGSTECIHYDKVGCFRDDLTEPRPLPTLTENYRDTFDWSKPQQTIKRMISSCAKAASQNNFTVFGLQYYGECWSGMNAAHTYAKDGRSFQCLMAISDTVFKECNDSSSEPCIGAQSTNYVYKIGHPVNGNFTSWSSWSRCSKICGTGYQRRTRSCTNPPPSRCGKSCIGDTEEVLDCNTQSCPAFVGGLTECIEYQKLGCFFDDLSKPRPLPKLLENYRGTFNWSNVQQTINSKFLLCAEAASRNNFAVFGLQYYGECWSGVNATHTYADDGRSTRCMMAISNMVLKECNDSSPEPCVGIQHTNYVYRIVHTVDGNFTPWSSWSRCSKICGTGYQRRTRSCTNPPPSRCGKSCIGDTEDVLDCNTQSCPTPEPCENNHKDCDTYRELGLCTDSYPEVLRICKKSCGRCP